ncbi:DUF3040 domain-containing protein [Actinomadura viridis]|uniref:DUF3040 domain-containing protein n=1 Tax=Actinomadura viridis TaxID=58110 RepID=UPI00368DB801
MALTADEIRTLNEIARGTAEEDPEFVRHLTSFGAPRPSGRVLPSRRTIVPWVMAGVLLAVGVVVASRPVRRL